MAPMDAVTAAKLREIAVFLGETNEVALEWAIDHALQQVRDWRTQAEEQALTATHTP